LLVIRCEYTFKTISKLALSDKRYVTDKMWKRNGGNGEVTVKTKNETGFGKK